MGSKLFEESVSLPMEFEGLQLLIAPKESVLRMKQALAHRKKIDNVDISGMKQILNS